jgi:hypothetical protein
MNGLINLHMKKHFYFLICLGFLFSCKKEEKNIEYPTIDYLTVKLKLDTLNKSYRESGIFPTVISTSFNGKKAITFFGASHVRDAEHPQFKLLMKSFNEQNPQIAFNEGGQIPDSVHFSSVKLAVENEGETGVLKMLCDQKGIKMMNGDMTEKEEFAALLAKFPRDQVYLYLATERFLNPYKQGFLGKQAIEKMFLNDCIKYLGKNDFKPTKEEKSFNYLKKLYQKHFKKALDLENLVEVHDYYLTNTGKFGKIGRASKQIRDQILLAKIDKALDTHDRVFVVFGTSHFVAVQPALQYIIDKH